MVIVSDDYAMLKKILEQQGVLNVDEYLVSPEQISPPQPDPVQQMQTQMAAKRLELQERQTGTGAPAWTPVPRFLWDKNIGQSAAFTGYGQCTWPTICTAPEYLY